MFTTFSQEERTKETALVMKVHLWISYACSETK